MAPDVAGEEVLRLAEGNREQAKEVGREPFVRPINGNQCFGCSRGFVRVDVGCVGIGRIGLGAEVVPVVVDRSEEVGLAQVGRRLLAQGVREAAGRESMIAPLARQPGRVEAVLPGLGQVEQRAGPLEGPLDDLGRDAVSGDGEEPDLLEGPGDAGGNHGAGAPVEEGGDVDRRNMHRVRIRRPVRPRRAPRLRRAHRARHR